MYCTEGPFVQSGMTDIGYYIKGG